MRVLLFSLLIQAQVTLASDKDYVQLELSERNPGELTAELLPAKKASDNLVVLLHGCTQTGRQFAKNSGFESLANDKGFHLLVINQSQNNNPQNCFNWFSELDNQKDGQELISIRQFIQLAQHRQNASNVYLAGLSAGGAMVSNLISHYPAQFEGAGLIAAIPYPCAQGLIQAIACMKGGPNKKFVSQRAEAVQTEVANLIVISSIADQIVSHKNSQVLVETWLNQNAPKTSATVHTFNGYKTSTWQGVQSNQLHFVELNDLSHGMPVNPSIASGGEQGQYFLKSEFSAAIYLVNAWRL